MNFARFETHKAFSKALLHNFDESRNICDTKLVRIVVQDEDKNRIPRVSITAKRLSYPPVKLTSQSDVCGEATIEINEIGQYEFCCQVAGYLPVSMLAMITDDLVSNITITLRK